MGLVLHKMPEFTRKERKEKGVDNISPRMRIWSVKTLKTGSSSGETRCIKNIVCLLISPLSVLVMFSDSVLEFIVHKCLHKFWHLVWNSGSWSIGAKNNNSPHKVVPPNKSCKLFIY